MKAQTSTQLTILYVRFSISMATAQASKVLHARVSPNQKSCQQCTMEVHPKMHVALNYPFTVLVKICLKTQDQHFFFFWQYKGGVKLLSDYECHIHMPYSYAILLRFHTSSCVLHTLPGNIDHKKILLKVLKHPHTIRKCLPIGGFSLTTCFSWRLWNTQDVVMNTLMKTEQ